MEYTDLNNQDIVDDVEETLLVNKYLLQQNYPNPFNPSTVIEYSIPAFSELAYSETVSQSSSLKSPLLGGDQRGGLLSVKLVVYDVLGREVATLVNEQQRPGSYKVQFSAKGGSASGGNASGLSSGVYYYRLTTGNYIETKKMLMIK